MRWTHTAVMVAVLAGLGLGCSSSKEVSSKPANAPAVADEKPLTPTVPGAPVVPGRSSDRSKNRSHDRMCLTSNRRFGPFGLSCRLFLLLQGTSGVLLDQRS